jgi:hypothetical protein
MTCADREHVDSEGADDGDDGLIVRKWTVRSSEMDSWLWIRPRFLVASVCPVRRRQPALPQHYDIEA